MTLAVDPNQDSGVDALVARSYNNIARSSPPPIAYFQIVLTARRMGLVFAEYGSAASRAKPTLTQTPFAESSLSNGS